ncbi:MAG: secondary thiamine-phosphate synthase enzyme YjbQ [Candidatus Omnitrophica bacterium]|nr:secondary thiamine-phosphate synthase enzyme YjbQ [Candidatus Omnitrophota bacterium]
MDVKTEFVVLNSVGDTDIINITNEVENNLKDTGFREGSVTIFSSGSTGGLTTIEYEPGLKKDFRRLMEKIVPKAAKYEHDETWHDGNGHSHLRSSLVKPSLTVPFAEGKLLLGTWQQIVFVDFDVRQRRREIVTQFIGK